MANARNRATREDPPEDDDDLDERIATAVNAAVGDHFRRKIPKMLTDALNKPLGELRDLIERSAQPGATGSPDDEPDDEPDDPPARRGRTRQAAREREQPDQRDRGAGERDQPGRGRRNDPEVVKLRQKVDTMEAERAREREQARNRDRDGMLREHLTKLNVEPNRMRGAIAVLRESTRFDDKTGTWSYVAGDEELDLDAGVAEWAGTDEGKAYLAPPQRSGAGTGAGVSPQIRQPVRSGGSGARPGAGRATGATSPTGANQQRGAAKSEAVQNLAGAVDALLGGAVQIG